jgi:hypothetical protein
VLHVSSTLSVTALVIAGAFSVGLGVVHLVIPRLLDYSDAIGQDGRDVRPLHRLGIGRRGYQVRRADTLGIAWVMSNSASYVLLTIGVIDFAWAAGWRGLPIAPAALWIAGWWAIRAGSQFVVGRRPLDIGFAAWFAALAVVHVALGLAWLVP